MKETLKGDVKLVRHVEGLWFYNEEVYQEWKKNVGKTAEKLAVFVNVKGHVVALWELDIIDTMDRLKETRIH